MSHKRLALVLSVVFLGSVSLEGQQLEEAAQEIANQISLSLIEEGKKNIAVLPLTDLRNKTSLLGEAFSEELFNRLFRLRQGKYEIVERSKIRAIWNEQTDFSDQWLLDNMANFSSLLSADAILVGTHFELDGYHRINARLLAVPSGKFLATASTRLQTVSGLRTGGSPQGRDGSSGEDPLGAPISTWEGSGVRIDLLPCELSNDKLTCEFLATRADRDRTLCLYESRLVERSATQVASSALEFGVESSEDRVCAEMIKGVPMRGRVSFKGLDHSLALSGISAIELILNDGLKAQFLDVRPN